MVHKAFFRENVLAFHTAWKLLDGAWSSRPLKLPRVKKKRLPKTRTLRKPKTKSYFYIKNTKYI